MQNFFTQRRKGYADGVFFGVIQSKTKNHYGRYALRLCAFA